MNFKQFGQIFMAAVLGVVAAQAEPKLTGIYMTSTDNAGKLQGVGAHHFKTFNHGGHASIFLVEGSDPNGPIVNGPNTAANSIVRSLPVGTHTYTMLVQRLNSYSWTQYALNLYFDFQNEPSISGWAPLNIQSRDFFPDFTANPGPMLGVNGAKPSPGLIYKNGQIEVRLTAFHFSNPTVFNLDRVVSHEVRPDRVMDYVGSFTLEVSGPPEIYAGGTVNAASFTKNVAPGSIFSIFGSGLAKGTTNTPGAPLLTNLGGVTVSVAGRNVPLFFTSPGQINAQLPYDTQAGPAQVVVSVNGVPSNTGTIAVLANAPGIFQFGEKRAVVQNGDYSVNTAENPAAPGTVVTAYLTGTGALDFPVATGEAAGSTQLSRPVGVVTATINGQPVHVEFAGLTPGFVGLMQVNLRVPALGAGTYPLVVTVGGEKSNSALFSIKQ